MFGQDNDAFQRALDEARRNDREIDDGGFPPRPNVRAPVDFGPALGPGGEARFGLALDWTVAPAEPPAPRAPDTAPPHADAPNEIADELGLAAGLTLDELASRWRSFVWRNHPDRQPIEARERANARVAIANALYERARREFARRR
jgi:hypothetical protein